MLALLKTFAAPLLARLPGKFLIGGVLVAAIAGAFLLQNARLDRAQEALAAATETLAAERRARARAEGAVQAAVARAERLAAARDAARARLSERLAAVASAQGECLDTALPPELLD